MAQTPASVYGGVALGSRATIAGMESTTGDILPFFSSLCQMVLNKHVSNIFAGGVAKPEIPIETAGKS
ncbi:MAG: hypothetical protein OEV57_01995 [Dehalococcoidia bacterium]|nr:hypothetical protein [Dehalococcoidia bacterium]